MTHVLITGATGFVGSNLVRKLLESNKDIFILARKESNFWRLNDILSQVKLNVVDMGNIERLKKTIKKIQPNIVYHLATYGGYPFQQDVLTTLQNNLIYSVNLMMALQGCRNLEKFINVGSSSEYGPKIKPMHETDITEPTTPYGITKVAQTLFTKYFSSNCKLPAITLRLFSVYGPYEEPGRLICDVMTGLVTNRIIKLSSPMPRRDYVYVDDVIDALVKSSESSFVNGEVFNIGSGKDYSVGEVMNIAYGISDTSHKHLWGQKKKRSFDSNMRWIADIRKANLLLKWKPATSLKEGMMKTFRWYQDNIHLYQKTHN